MFLFLGAAGAIAIGQALALGPGHGRPMTLLTVALGATALAVLHPTSWTDGPTQWSRPAHFLIGAGLCCQLIELAALTVATYTPQDRLGVAPLLVAAAGVGVILAAILRRRARLVTLAIPIGIHAAVGIWVIRSTPDPFIDVYRWQVEALHALGRGINPFAITMPNIYSDGAFYGPGLVVDGRVQMGLQYPPLSLLLAAPGHLLAGDFRYANEVATLVGALLIATCRPNRVALMAAALFLMTPRTFTVLQSGWTEPYVVLAFASTVWCACRAPALLPVALGLFFAVKQYAVLAAPLVVLLHAGPAPWRTTARTLVRAALVAAVVTLPFVVWDPRAFVRSVIQFQVLQPFRIDSLSYPAVLARATGWQAPASIAFVITALTIVASVRYARRNAAGFAAAAALAFLTFFLFNKQAFANYYFFVVGALCCAVAAAGLDAESSA